MAVRDLELALLFHKGKESQVMVRYQLWPSLGGALLLLAELATAAGADTILLSNRSALQGGDTVDWGGLGPAFTVVPNSFSITSAGGVGLTVSQATGPFERRDQGFPSGGWNGNFAPGDHLLWTRGTLDSSGPITLDFGAKGILAGGAQIESDFPGPIVARIEALDAAGDVLANFIRAGVDTTNADNSAIFIGVRSSEADIHELIFSLDPTSSGHSPGDFAINQVSFAVPEPGTLILFGLGILGALGCGLMVQAGRSSVRPALPSGHDRVGGFPPAADKPGSG
jgi:hypothetical protein